MSLLDDVSIVVTPNGYKAGELYAVVPVPTEGAEEVTNGDFDGGTTDWNLSDAVWQQGSGNGEVKLTKPSSGNSVIYQTGLSFAANTVLRYRFNIVDYSGAVSVRIDGYSASNPLNTPTSFAASEGDVDVYITTDRVGSSVFLYLTGGSTGDYVVLDNVSVKVWTAADMDVTRATAATRVDEDGLVNYAEVLGDEEIVDGDFPSGTTAWSFGGGWSLGVDSAEATSGSTGKITQTNTLNGKYAQVTLTVSNYGGTGLILVDYGSTASAYITSNGTHTLYGTYDQNNFEIYKTSDFSGTVTNVSVKEVTRDNVPRIDYTGGGCPHILSEPMRTNLVAYSEAITQANGYSPNGVTLASNQGTTPMGTNNATKLTSTGADPYIQYAVPNTNATFTLSVYAKGVGSSVGKDINFFLIRDNYAEAVQSSQFTLTNEWVRYTATLSLSTNPTTDVIYRIDAPSVGVAGDEVLIWGAQLEVGSYATSYIPTSGSTVTRNQDIFTRDGIGSLINSTEGVLFVEMAALSDDLSTRMISLSDGSNTNRIHCFYYSASNTIGLNYRVAGVTEANITASLGDETDFKKIAFRWESGNFKLYIDGVPSGTDANTTMLPSDTLNKLAFKQGDGGNNFYGKVKQLQVYTTALTDEQLLQLTGTSGTDFYESYAEMASALTYTIQ